MTENVITPKLLSTRERLLADIDAAISELASANGTNMSDYSEMYYDKDDQLEEDELLRVEGSVPTPNRTLTSSSSQEQQLSSAQRARLEELERSFSQYVRKKSEERERVFDAWIIRIDSADASSPVEDMADAELDRQEEQDRLENEVFEVDLKLKPLKTRFPKFRKAIGTSGSSYVFRNSLIVC